MCEQCFEGIVQLGMTYARQWGWISYQINRLIELLYLSSSSVDGHQQQQQHRPGLLKHFYVQKGEDVTGADDQRLLNFKFGWALYQVLFCEAFRIFFRFNSAPTARMPKTLASDIFVVKKRESGMFELSYLVGVFFDYALIIILV